MIDDRLAGFSRALFKNAYVLPAAVQICLFSDKHFHASAAREALDVSDNVIDPGRKAGRSGQRGPAHFGTKGRC